jgi:DNA-binding NarL/FixJ family response regulator
MTMAAVSRRTGEDGWDLAPGDLEILRRMAAGETIEALARHIGRSERTVRRRLRALADEIGVDTTIEVVIHAVRRHLI